MNYWSFKRGREREKYCKRWYKERNLTVRWPGRLKKETWWSERADRCRDKQRDKNFPPVVVVFFFLFFNLFISWRVMGGRRKRRRRNQMRQLKRKRKKEKKKFDNIRQLTPKNLLLWFCRQSFSIFTDWFRHWLRHWLPTAKTLRLRVASCREIYKGDSENFKKK